MIMGHSACRIVLEARCRYVLGISQADGDRRLKMYWGKGEKRVGVGSLSRVAVGAVSYDLLARTYQGVICMAVREQAMQFNHSLNFSCNRSSLAELRRRLR